MRPVVFACLVACQPVVADPPPPTDPVFGVEKVTADVAALAAPELEGRLPGSLGDGMARAQIVARWTALGLTPAGDGGTYEQAFVDQAGRATANVLAVLPGRDPGEAIVVSAHHDHLGPGFPGANDDASGVAALSAIAEAAASGEPLARTLVFAAFGSEESGYEGSHHFADHPPGPLDGVSFVYNVNLDMIGSYRGRGQVSALGTQRGTRGRELVEELAANKPFLHVDLGSFSRRSDNVAFCENGIPYVFFWTPDPACYHAACDTVEALDAAHMAQIAELAFGFVRALADDPTALSADVRPGEDICRSL
jgi:hypothetical protein